jgi:hypothetical protein
MKGKLAAKRLQGRGGWQEPDVENGYLSRLLREHVDKGDPVDVANLAMMIHQRGERIGPENEGATCGAIERAEAERDDARAELAAAKQREARRSFPILKGEGAKIDYQLVSDHAEQVRSNHYQSVERLAERGGLSWCELYAVLHNRKWEKIDNNEAMIACRALEARYLAALSSRPDGGEAPEIGKVKP